MGTQSDQIEYRSVDRLPPGCRALLVRRGARTVVLLDQASKVRPDSPDVLELLRVAARGHGAPGPT